MKIEKGQKYLLFKGREVEILELGKHSETLEEYVIYIHTDEENPTIWIRALEMLQENSRKKNTQTLHKNIVLSELRKKLSINIREFFLIEISTAPFIINLTKIKE